MYLLPFDTETTGLFSKNKPLNDPSQPHLVSLSALQVRPDDLFIQQSMSKLVIPDGWEWDDSDESPDRAFQVHQVKVETAQSIGRTEKQVLDEFITLFLAPDTKIIAHNLAFDAGVIACAIARYYGQGATLKAWAETDGFCTMLESKTIVDARTATGRKKSPNLKESYEFFTGEALEDHHTANRDAVAALQIYVGLQEHGNE